MEDKTCPLRAETTGRRVGGWRGFGFSNGSQSHLFNFTSGQSQWVGWLRNLSLLEYLQSSGPGTNYEVQKREKAQETLWLGRPALEGGRGPREGEHTQAKDQWQNCAWRAHTVTSRETGCLVQGSPQLDRGILTPVPLSLSFQERSDIQQAPELF